MTIPSEDLFCFFFCCLTQDNPIDFVHEWRPRTAENKEPTPEDGMAIQTHTHLQSCVRCILRTSYCSPLLFPLLLDLNFFRHLPLDLYTFFNRGHLLTITANRGPIVPLCYKSSVYPLDTLTHTYTGHMALTGLIFNRGNCLRCPWSLPWCPFKSPNRNLQIPHRGALCQGKIALPLQVRSIRPALMGYLIVFSIVA